MIAEYYKCIPSSNAVASASPFDTPSKFQIMPALGTHAPMTHEQIESMYGAELAKLHESQNGDPFLVITGIPQDP